MGMFLTWFRIFLARQLRQPLFYLQIGVMLLAICIVNGVSIPSRDSLQVGVICESEMGEAIYNRIAIEEQSVKIVRFEDEAEMKACVKTGKIDCGFALPESIDGDETIKYYMSPFTRAGELEKEAIYAAAYQNISEEILIEADKEIYGDSNQDRQKYLLDKNQELLIEEQVLTIDWEEVGGSKTEDEHMIKPYFTQITAGIFAVMIIIVGGICFRDKTCTGSILYSISAKQRFMMCLANDLAVGIIPIVIVILSIILSR